MLILWLATPLTIYSILLYMKIVSNVAVHAFVNKLAAYSMCFWSVCEKDLSKVFNNK